MKRSLRNLLVIVVILALSVASNMGAQPADALGAMENVPLTLPTTWDFPPVTLDASFLTGIWGVSDTNVYAVGYGYDTPPAGQDPVDLPVFYTKNGASWDATGLPLPFDPDPPYDPYDSGRLESVWAVNDSDHPVFAVGHGISGGITQPLLYLEYNACCWNLYTLTPPGTSSGELYGVWGFSSNNVYAVGYGTSGGNTIPLIYHFNGGWWSAGVAGLGPWTNVFLKDVWGSGPGDIYAVGSGDVGGNALPVIYHYDGTTWTPSSPGLFMPPGWILGSLDSVWGSGPNDIYAVGSGKITSTGDTLPLLLHYQDGSWSASSPNMPSGWTTASLASVWGLDANEVYLAGTGQGSEPLIYRKTSTGGWAPSYSVEGWSSGGFNDIWGAGANDLYAVGSGTGNLPLLAQAVGDTTAPGAVSLMAMPGGVAGTVNLSWTAPADDAGHPESGPVDHYKIIYSQSALTDCSSGTEMPNPPVPKTPGSTELITISGLEPGEFYNFSVCTWDEEDNPDPVLGVFATPRSAVAGFAGEGRYDDTDVNWTYTGTWSDYSGAGPYNNSARYASTAGSEAQFTFNGVKFTLTYLKAPNRGLIDIYIDGVKRDQINAYSAALKWQQTWTSPPLALGNHTVRFVHAGGRPYIDIDAIQVFGQQPVVSHGTYDDGNTAWQFSNGWNTYTGAGPANNTSHYTSSVGSEAQLIFSGNRFTFTYLKAPNRGLIDVFVGDTKIATLNAKSSTTAWQQTWTSPILTSGPHIVRFVHGGGGTYIDVDVIEILAPSDTTAPAAITDLSGAAGATTGSVDLSWTAPGDDDNTGTATNYLVRYSVSAITDDTTWDAATPGSTGIPTPLTAGSPQTMTVSGLTPGASYFFAVRAQDEEENLGGLSNLTTADAQSPRPVPAGTYDDTDVNWLYTGPWTAYTGSGPANNTSRYVSTSGSEAQITINGSKFIFTYVKASNRGLIDVYVDGIFVQRINAKSTTTTWQATWASPILPPGIHVVRFVHAGSGTYIDVDKIQVFDAVGAGTYEDTNINWAYTGTWTSYTGSGPSGSNDHYTDVVGSDAQFTFTGTGFTFTYVKASNRGSIDVYVDGVKVGNINARSMTTTWQATWPSPTFPSGTHTVRFVHVGASGTYIDVDAITITP